MAVRFRVPILANPQLLIRLASTREEVEAANRLVFRNYVEEGYWGDDEKNLAKNRWLHSRHRVVIVAVWDNEVVGTVSLIRDSVSGLPSDAFQPAWLRRWRGYGDELGEISALAVEKRRAGLKKLPFFLMKYYMQYSFYYTRIDRLVKACQPKHGDFYADVLRFEKAGGIVYNGYARRPSQLLSMDLIDAHQLLSDYYEPKMEPHNFYRFLMVNEHPNLEFPDPALACRTRQQNWAAYARSRQRATAQYLPSVAKRAAQA